MVRKLELQTFRKWECFTCILRPARWLLPASSCSVYLVPSTTTASGATYPTYTSGSSYKYSGNGYVGSIIINPATQSSNVVDEILPGIIIPAGFFKCILVNNTGVTLPTSGNTLDLYPTATSTKKWFFRFGAIRFFIRLVLRRELTGLILRQ